MYSTEIIDRYHDLNLIIDQFYRLIPSLDRISIGRSISRINAHLFKIFCFQVLSNVSSKNNQTIVVPIPTVKKR
jgi:hypothetical protein